MIIDKEELISQLYFSAVDGTLLIYSKTALLAILERLVPPSRNREPQLKYFPGLSYRYAVELDDYIYHYHGTFAQRSAVTGKFILS